MKIAVLDCNNPYVCLNYHSRYVSTCCNASTTQRRITYPAKDWSQLTAKQKTKTQYRDFCDNCENYCDITRVHGVKSVIK